MDTQIAHENTSTASNVFQLPTPLAVVKHPEARIPIAFVRSSLFNVALTGEMADRRLLAAERGPLGIEITYSGPHLNQDHFKAWQAALYLAKLNDVIDGSVFVVPGTELLRHMGKTYRDHEQRKLLWELLEDLQQASVRLKSHRSRYIGSLIMSATKDDITGQVGLRLNPELAQLLADETLDNDMMRMVALGRDQLAIWLHNYFASWGPYRNVPVRDLHQMCGTKDDLRRFRYRLKQSMAKLMTGERPFIQDFQIGKDDVLYVRKSRTAVRLLSAEHKEKSQSGRNMVRTKAAEAASKRRSSVCL